MKNFRALSTIALCLFFATSYAQIAYKGKGDQKFQVGASFQKNGSGIYVTFDQGIGENISIGLVSGYLLGVDAVINADFEDRIDLKTRFNANLGNVLNISKQFDLYPGLNLGFRNFGGHVGSRFFFSNGFGLFTELTIPIAKYNTGNLTPAEELNNQFMFSFGASFNL